MMNYCYPHTYKTRGAIYSFIVGVIVIFNSSCGSKSNSPVEAADSTKQDVTVVREDVLKSLHRSDITTQLHSKGIDFNKEFLHDVSRTNHYTRRSNKGAAAANLGIYLSDLNYLIAFDQRESAGLYFDACLKLSEYSGLKKQFGEALQFGFNEIISGDQELEKKFNQLFRNADNTATDEEFKKLHASALTGYYLEELYHVVRFVQSYQPADTTTQVFLASVKTLVDQKDELNNLIAYFDHIQLKPAGISAYQELLALQRKYLALDREKLISETDPSALLQNGQLQGIFNDIISIRQRIIDF